MSERFLPRRVPEGFLFGPVPSRYDGVRPIWHLYRDPDTSSTAGVMLFVRDDTSPEDAAEAVARMIRHKKTLDRQAR